MEAQNAVVALFRILCGTFILTCKSVEEMSSCCAWNVMRLPQ